MRRAFGFDVLVCPRCGGRLRLVALIDEAAAVQRILRHLGLPTEVPEARPARAPPLSDSAAQSPRRLCDHDEALSHGYGPQRSRRSAFDTKHGPRDGHSVCSIPP
jgi:hypothetical protein